LADSNIVFKLPHLFDAMNPALTPPNQQFFTCGQQCPHHPTTAVPPIFLGKLNTKNTSKTEISLKSQISPELLHRCHGLISGENFIHLQYRRHQKIIDYS
jgi:hypothetical protein